MQTQYIETADGSHTLYVPQLNETYHSRHGAIRESRHVFIKHGLDYVLKTKPKDVYHIFETGLGTGLNALLSVLYTESLLNRKAKIYYTAVEASPLENAIVEQLNYVEILAAGTEENIPQQQQRSVKQLFDDIHSCEWEKFVPVTSVFQLKKTNQKIEELVLTSQSFDLIYF